MEHRTELMDRLERELRQCRLDITRLDGRVSTLETIIGGHRNTETLPAMTTKQHAALQMLLRGAGNAEIAGRFGVTVNTAKVYVRSLFAKFGVHNRASVVAAAKAAFDAMPNAEYMRWSGGLPKTWDSEWSEADPFAPLYRYDPATDGELDDGTQVEEEQEGRQLAC